MKMQRTMVAILAMAAVVALGTTAQAAMLTITLNQVGNNVVGTAGGTVNTSGLLMNYASTGLGMMYPRVGFAGVGARQTAVRWSGLAGDRSNCGLGSIAYADTGTGDMVGVNLLDQYVFLPNTYVSGSLLSGTSTWNNKSFENLGITPGTYTMTYNGGADSVVLQVGSVPEPATMSVLALGGIATLIRRRRRA